MSDHRQFQHSIAELAAGRLAGAERERLLEHVATCMSCAAVLATAREFAALRARGQDHAPAPHPDVLSLRDYAKGERPEGDSIRRHLEHCDACRLEVAVWRLRPGHSSAAPTPAKPRSTARLPLLAAGLLAAGLLIGLLTRPLFDRGPAGSRTREWSGPVGALIVHDALRGESGVTRVALEPGQPVLPVTIYFEWLEAPEELGPLLIDIRDRRGEAVWSGSVSGKDAVEAASSGTVSLLVPLSRLSDGPYEVTLSRAGGRDPAPLIQRRFELVEDSGQR